MGPGDGGQGREGKKLWWWIQGEDEQDCAIQKEKTVG